MSIVLKAVTTIILVVAYVGTIPLVMNEYKNGNICPKLLGIPACYIILACLTLACIGFFLRGTVLRKLFYVGVVPALLIATYGSLGQMFGFAKYPKTSSGIPMCYISFGIFSFLFIFNNLIDRLAKQHRPTY